jgi:hypothetical protein
LQAALALTGIALLTFALYLYVLPNSQMSEAEARIAQLRAERDALRRQNAEIIRLAASFTALTRIEKRARELGMEPPRQIFYGTLAPVQPPDGRPQSATQAPALSGPAQSPAPPWQDAIGAAGAWLADRWRQASD